MSETDKTTVHSMSTNVLERDQIPQFRKWLVGLLRESVVTVEFVKTDGTTRTMRCTLKTELLPPQPLAEGERKSRRVDDGVLPVWSVDDAGFRSFRLDKVLGVRFTIGDGGCGDTEHDA